MEERQITNRLINRLIRDARRRQKLCLLIGSGVSTAIAKAPGWGDLVKSLASLAEEMGVNDPAVREVLDHAVVRDPLGAASTIRRRLQETEDGRYFYQEWLDLTFGDLEIDRHSSLLQSLASVHRQSPHVRFATTNYDNIVDLALTMETRTWRDDTSRDYFVNDGNIMFHAHGVYTKPNTIVFDHGDYRYLGGYNDGPGRPRQEPLERLLDEYNVVFVGCGATLTDPHFSEIFKRLEPSERAQHVYFHRQGETVTLPQGSRVIPYAYRDHQDLPRLLRNFLLEESNPPGQPNGATPAAPRNDVSSTAPEPPAPPAHTLSSLQEWKEWLRQYNERQVPERAGPTLQRQNHSTRSDEFYDRPTMRRLR